MTNSISSESTSPTLLERAKRSDDGAWSKISQLYSPRIYACDRRAGLHGRNWIAAFAATKKDSDEPTFVPIDGKTVRRSGGGSAREKPLHIVSTWATTPGMILGQVAVDTESNEITAIPKLIGML